ncbi:MAG: class I SAM-dependent methyltransferase [Caldilineaceae bacterium]|nr:class I SAM-dependent methyltransferase [Caldilineaceae bacterium]
MPQSDLENRYYQYLREHGYSRADSLLAVLNYYAPYFRDFDRIVDIGCGHGEFLQILRDAGASPVGVDIDPAMVARCQELGLEAHHADILEWLPAQSQPFDAAFSTNVMEHLPPEQVMAIVRSAFDALRPGGMLLLGVPNPESAIVQFHEFWRDPTHVRLYSRQLLEFFLFDAGFREIQSGENIAARWEGVDKVLEGPDPVDRVEFELDRWSPLPIPPQPGASWRERVAFSVSHFAYKKFIEPYTSPMRQAIALEMQALQETEQRLNEQIRRVMLSFHPSREVFVLGFKPDDRRAEPSI